MITRTFVPEYHDRNSKPIADLLGLEPLISIMTNEYQLLKIRRLPREAMKDRIEPLGRSTSLDPPSGMQWPWLNRSIPMQQIPQMLIVLKLLANSRKQLRPLLKPIRFQLNRFAPEGS
jgi:hypothetical protein